jgi:5-oxoprolinase (ATP-hydrolysing)
MSSVWQLWVDTGGTFTDCLARDPQGREHRAKALSSGSVRARVAARSTDRLTLEGTWDLPDDFFRGFKLIHQGEELTVTGWLARSRELRFGHNLPSAMQAGALIELRSAETAPALAARLVTRTPLEQALPPIQLRFATTRGTNALLEGKGAPTALFITKGFGDLLRIGTQQRPDLFAVVPSRPKPLHGPVVEVTERTDAAGNEVLPLLVESVRTAAEAVLAKGIQSAAICLMHSWRDPSRERQLADFLISLGFTSVSCSAELAPFIKLLPRAETAVVDATLAPVMQTYLDRLSQSFKQGSMLIMTSAGGLTQRASYRAKDSLLSGPAGGAVGAAAAARQAGLRRIISFDMGGTSADVARWSGQWDYLFQHQVGPARVFAPSVKIETVAAGGGSICGFDGVGLYVGPESAGSEPGCACYGAGGPLTLTDVNLLLGRLAPERFGIPIFPEASRQRLQETLDAIVAAGGKSPTEAELLEGFLEIADERMADAIRKISAREGYDPAEHALVAFGGAGGLHACGVARRLGIRTILFPQDAGLLSARGLRDAAVERFAERQILRPLTELSRDLPRLARELLGEARRSLIAEGFDPAQVRARRVEVELRFAGQDATLTLPFRQFGGLAEEFGRTFVARYGYAPVKPVEAVALRAIAAVSGEPTVRERFPGGGPRLAGAAFDRDRLAPGSRILGPALVQDRFSTLWLEEGWEGLVGERGSLRMTRRSRKMRGVPQRPRLVALELFISRLSSIVEEMGALLQRAALSTNVKERLDFSCAILDASGELVVNAPHIPVHLGALGLCVRQTLERLPLGPGDVAVTNHPGYGGSHLPDVTLIAPVHSRDGCLLGYVANRAHHAEIGGLRPGSMSPEASNLAEEGVVIEPMLLVRSGTADWPAMAERLNSGPFPTRALEENLADLGAQLAAVRHGIETFGEVGSRVGPETCQGYLEELKERAAASLRSKIAALPPGRRIVRETLDDGWVIQVAIEAVDDTLTIDFSGTSPAHPGNLNATPAIVRSAVIYCLRLLAGEPMPLNEGLLRPVKLHVPECFLSPTFSSDPSRCPAVAGGNVETSQRMVDALLQVLSLAACSQGTMNNVIFGTVRGSHYETVGGGCGAAPGASGGSGLHSHMTNTAITDPEILEWRFPVRLERFELRRGSGGAGRWPGGDGLRREIRFLDAASLSMLTQRRQSGPAGAAGGSEGLSGRQLLLRADGSEEELPSAAQRQLQPGDRLLLETPGGGGWEAKDFSRTKQQ